MGAGEMEGLWIEFPISSETENSNWLKGDKGVITLTMANHDCFRARLAVRGKSLAFVMEGLIDYLLDKGN